MSSSSSSAMLASKLNKNSNSSGNNAGKVIGKRTEQIHDHEDDELEGHQYDHDESEIHHNATHMHEEEANMNAVVNHDEDDSSDADGNEMEGHHANMQLQHVLLPSSHLQQHYNGHNTSLNQSFSNESTYSGNDDHRSKKQRVLHPIWEYCAEPHPQFPDSRVICKFCGISLRLPFGYKLERLREHYGLNVHFIRETKRGKGCIKNPFAPNEILPFSTPGASTNSLSGGGEPRNSGGNYLDWKDHAALPYKLDQQSGSNNNPDTSIIEHNCDSESDEQHQQSSSSSVNNPNRVKKRSNYLSWDDYFMSISLLSAMRSKDPNTQVGACIVNEDNRIVGIGYNGFPRGCSDDELPWNREAEHELDTKYPYVCHAEVNAILNKNSSDVKDCKMYVALFPCNECAKMIIQSGIKEVIYMSDKYANTPSMIASRRMFNMAKVKLRQFYPTQAALQINFTAAL